MKKRTAIAAAFLSLGLFGTSCLGPNKLFNGLHDWNQEVTDKDWANELIFLGCTFLPVYSFAYLIDIVALNTIDYWSGGKDEM